MIYILISLSGFPQLKKTLPIHYYIFQEYLRVAKTNITVFENF